MIRCLCIDDESVAHDIIKNYCDQLAEVQLVKSCYNAMEAFEYLNKEQIDLIFLDLNMPQLKGFELLQTLMFPPKVIVTTAYSEFALEGYEHNVIDYLLKPFSFERFLKAVNKYFIPVVNSSVFSIPKAEPSHVFIQSNKKYFQLDLHNLLFIEAIGNYVKIHTVDNVITIREKFSTMLRLIPDSALLQVHKSFAVSPKQISSIEGAIIIVGTNSIPIGKLYKENINRLLK